MSDTEKGSYGDTKVLLRTSNTCERLVLNARICINDRRRCLPVNFEAQILIDINTKIGGLADMKKTEIH